MKTAFVRSAFAITAFALSWWALFASYSSLPQAVGGGQLSSSNWNALVNYANKAVKQEAETLVVSWSSIGVWSSGIVRTTHPYVSISTSSASDKRTGIQMYANGVGTFELWVDVTVNNSRNFFIHDNITNTTRFFIDPAGQVGIGTNLPAAALDVNGSIRTAAGQNFKIRYGTSSVTVSSLAAHSWWAYATVNYWHTFTNVPMVFITGNSPAGGYIDSLLPSAISKTTTGFTPHLFNSSGTAASWTYSFNWVAIGE